MVKLVCRFCGMKRYSVIDISICGDDKYVQKNKCWSCGKISVHTVSLVSDVNAYRYIFRGYTMQFHRFIMELVLKRKLKSNERVMFKNGHKGDCRPLNLTVVTTNRKRK